MDKIPGNKRGLASMVFILCFAILLIASLSFIDLLELSGEAVSEKGNIPDYITEKNYSKEELCMENCFDIRCSNREEEFLECKDIYSSVCKEECNITE